MNIHLSDAQARRAGIQTSPALAEMRDRQAAILEEVRGLLGELDKATSDAQTRKIEGKHEKLIAEFDEIEGRANRLEGLEVRQGLSGSPGDADARLRRRPIPEDATIEPDGFRSLPEIPSTGLRRAQRMTDYVRRNQPDIEQPEIGLGRLLRAHVLGPKTDEEKRALSGGTTTAGGFTVPDILSAQFIDLARARAVTMRAGARTVLLQSDTNHIAKVAADPTPAWRSENAEVAESDPTFARVTFTPQSLAVQMKVSREVLEDSVNIDEILPHIIARAIALELDRVAMFGTGTPPEPEGIENFTGTQESAVSGTLSGANYYQPLIGARTLIKTANHDGPTAYIMHPRDEGALAEALDGEGLPYPVPPVLRDAPFLTTTAVPIDGGGGTESMILAGDFTKLMIGIRHDVTIQVLRERYQDYGQFGFIAFLRADIAAEWEDAFVKLTGILPE